MTRFWVTLFRIEDLNAEHNRHLKPAIGEARVNSTLHSRKVGITHMQQSAQRRQCHMLQGAISSKPLFSQIRGSGGDWFIPSARYDSTVIDVREAIWGAASRVVSGVSVWRESSWCLQRNVGPHLLGQDLRKRVGARMCMKDNDQGIT